MKIQRREIKRNASFHGVNFEVDLNLPLEHALATGTDEEAAEVSNNLRRKQNNDQFNIQIIRMHFFHILHNNLKGNELIVYGFSCMPSYCR